MLKIIYSIATILVFSLKAEAQVITNGPEIANSANKSLTKILDGDSTSFFAYRIRPVGDSAYSIIEKYNKSTLQQIYSTEINLKTATSSELIHIASVGNKLYLFFKFFNEMENKMSLYFQDINEEGQLMPDKGMLFETPVENRKFCDFEIVQNDDKTKFIINAFYKANKTENYKIDFLFLDSKTFEVVKTKSLDISVFSNTMCYDEYYKRLWQNRERISFKVDNDDNIFYGYDFPLKKIHAREAKSTISVIIIPKRGETKAVDMYFEFPVNIFNMKFVKNNNNELIVGGFLQKADLLTGKDIISTGTYGFTINLSNYEITGKALDLDQNSKHLSYRMDYMIPIGKSVYYVAEAYLTKDQQLPMAQGAGNQAIKIITNLYKDIVVTKYNPSGQFEWTTKIPYEFKLRDIAYAVIVKNYSVIEKNKKLYIFKDETLSSFCTVVSASNGAIDDNMNLNIKPYFFTPSPYTTHLVTKEDKLRGYRSSNNLYLETEILNANNHLFFYTHQPGKDRFNRMKLD
jgi:hypothetical protein